MPRKQKLVENPELDFDEQDIENEVEREREREKAQPEKEPQKEPEKKPEPEKAEPEKAPEKEPEKKPEPEKEPEKKPEPEKEPEKAPAKNADYTIEKATAASRVFKDDNDRRGRDKDRLNKYQEAQQRKKDEQAAKEKEAREKEAQAAGEKQNEKPGDEKNPEKEPEKGPEKKPEKEPEKKPEPEKKDAVGKEAEKKGEPVKPGDPEAEYDFGDDNEEAEVEAEITTAEKLHQLEERRKQLEQEEAEFQRQQEAKKSEPEKQKPVPKKDGKKQDEKEQEVKKKTEDQLLDDDVVQDNRKNPYKDEVNALTGIQDTAMQKQWKEVRTLRAMTRVIDKKSKEYQAVRKHLRALDEYTKLLQGRTQLSKEEMEKYELLTMRVLKASDNYDKAERDRLKKAGKKLTRQEEQRLRGIKEIKRSITQLREEMYDTELKRKKEEMEKKCQEKMGDIQKTLVSLHKTGAKSPKLREQLGGAVVKTLYYLNRMDSLVSSFKVKEGEAYPHTMKRLNRDINPTKKDFQNIAKHELTKNIVDAGMKAIQEGKEFTTDDIKRLQKEYLRKHARRLIQERKRREQIRNLGRKSQGPGMNQQAIPKPANVL